MTHPHEALAEVLRDEDLREALTLALWDEGIVRPESTGRAAVDYVLNDLASVLADHFAEAVTERSSCGICGQCHVDHEGDRLQIEWQKGEIARLEAEADEMRDRHVEAVTEARARELRQAADRMPAFRDGDQYGSSNKAAIAWLRARAESLAPEIAEGEGNA